MRDFKGKKLLVLGGTQISCEIIKKAQKMGIFVVVTDYNKPEDSPGKRLADQYFNISATDVDAVAELIKQEGINGVLVGFADVLLPYYAQICEKAGLPAYGTKEQFDIFTNKERYKALCKKFHVPTVEKYDVNDSNMNVMLDQIQYPILVKPVDSSGSRGISVCYTKDEFLDAYTTALSFSKEKKVLVEKYLPGEEATVFWLFDNGKYYLTGIGNRHVKNNQNAIIPLPVGYTFPATVVDKYRRETEANVKEMLSSVGIKNGMMFMQCKIENGECVVYDIGYRLTGSLEYTLFDAACGYNPLEMLICFALTGKMTEDDVEDKIDPMFFGKFPFNVSCLAGVGKIEKLEGIDAVLSMPEVADVVIEHYPGTTIDEKMKGLLSQIAVRVLGVVDKKDDLFRVMNKIDNTIRIVSDKGENIKLSGIEETDIQNNL